MADLFWASVTIEMMHRSNAVLAERADLRICLIKQ